MTKKNFIVIIFSIILTACGTKNHTPVPLAGLSVNVPEKIVFIQEKETSLPPYGYVQFCRDNPNECSQHSNPNRETSTETTAATYQTTGYTQPSEQIISQSPLYTPEYAVIALLDHINNKVNRNITQVTDNEGFGVSEYWRIPEINSLISDIGDCEDFALAKKKILIEQYGFNPNSLSISVLKRPRGDIHAVLMARTSYGDYVLDNLSNTIKPWHKTGYHWIKKQSYGNHNVWVNL